MILSWRVSNICSSRLYYCQRVYIWIKSKLRETAFITMGCSTLVHSWKLQSHLQKYYIFRQKMTCCSTMFTFSFLAFFGGKTWTLRKFYDKSRLYKAYKSFLKRNTMFFDYYVHILGLKLGFNLIWYGTLCII